MLTLLDFFYEMSMKFHGKTIYFSCLISVAFHDVWKFGGHENSNIHTLTRYEIDMNNMEFPWK